MIVVLLLLVPVVVLVHLVPWGFKRWKKGSRRLLDRESAFRV